MSDASDTADQSVGDRSLLSVHFDSVLFLCVANSARSQMAEALARQALDDHGLSDVVVQSAGSRPTRVNPFAMRVLAELGVDASAQRSKHVDDIDAAGVDLVISLCAEEECPAFLGHAIRHSWAMPDPDRKGEALSDDERLHHFRIARDEIARRVRDLVESRSPA